MNKSKKNLQPEIDKLTMVKESLANEVDDLY